MKRKRRLRNGIISFVLAFAIVLGTFSGIIPGTVTSVNAANTTITWENEAFYHINTKADSSSSYNGISVSWNSGDKNNNYFTNTVLCLNNGSLVFKSTVGKIKAIEITGQDVSAYEMNEGWNANNTILMWAGSPLDTVTLSTNESINIDDDKTLADYNIQKDSTLHVIFDNEYTVSFNTNGGSAVSSQTLVSGSKVTDPGDPEKDDYTFAGWYSDEGLTSQYNFDNEVSSDFTLYAKWTPIILMQSPEHITIPPTRARTIGL